MWHLTFQIVSSTELKIIFTYDYLNRKNENHSININILYLFNVGLSFVFNLPNCWTALQKTIELLQQYQTIIQDNIFNWLSELPLTWEALKKLGAQVKQVVQPLMTHQIELLKKRLSYYDFKQQRFLREFHAKDVFK